MKETKAQRLARELYYESLSMIEKWGYKENENGTPVSFSRVTDEACSTRTLNDVTKDIEMRQSIYNKMIEKGIICEPDYTNRCNAIKMALYTIEKHRRILKSL